jgi:hypothetical protein
MLLHELGSDASLVGGTDADLDAAVLDPLKGVDDASPVLRTKPISSEPEPRRRATFSRTWSTCASSAADPATPRSIKPSTAVTSLSRVVLGRSPCPLVAK